MGLAYLIFKKTVLESAMALTSNQDQEHIRGHGWNTLHPKTYCLLFESTQDQGSLTFWHQGPASWKTIFRRRVGWFRDDSSALHLLCTLFLLLLHRFHFRSSGIRSPEVGTPALDYGGISSGFFSRHLTWALSWPSLIRVTQG